MGRPQFALGGRFWVFTAICAIVAAVGYFSACESESLSVVQATSAEEVPLAVRCPQDVMEIFADPRTSFREELGRFIEFKCCATGEKSVVLEVGVWRGDFADTLLTRYSDSIKEYVMIEPAQKLVGQLTRELQRRLEEFPERFPEIKFRWINELSLDAAKLFQDEYFDWIYIDGLHTYDGVRTDVTLFWDKLKAGGLFSGHDFSMSRAEARADPWNTIAPWSGMRAGGKEKFGFPGSYKAVVQHARKHGLQVFYTLEGRYGESMWQLKDTSKVFRNNPSWFLFKHDYNVTEITTPLEYGWRDHNGVLIFSSGVGPLSL
uniref:Class I SAM-dependent methyltransferase n=1 Tax=Pyramimonas obovata TaxID=1411642 RepID=A0A7S0RFS6_9CHLO|mmetsp:Transcript_32432/g.70821  ORF Transcript_32432/g.70821 Transcript_32432/m.70821 type:complete len:318 (+) Transcript_32432:110-1063(+)